MKLSTFLQNLCGVPCPEKQSCFRVDGEQFSCRCPVAGFTGDACVG